MHMYAYHTYTHPESVCPYTNVMCTNNQNVYINMHVYTNADKPQTHVGPIRRQSSHYILETQQTSCEFFYPGRETGPGGTP